MATLPALPGAAQAQAPQARTRAQDAATRHQAERTEQANRDAAVADEASTAAPARTPAPEAVAGPRTSPAPRLNYGPVLTPRGQQGTDTVRKDAAEVRDETDTLAREAAPQPEHPQLTNSRGEKLSARQLEEQRRRAARRHQAWQGEVPIAPRPLRGGEASPATAAVPIPPPLPAPQPTAPQAAAPQPAAPQPAAPQPAAPSSSVIRACQGIVCTDAAGNTFNGSGNAGVSSNGRLCARSGTTVQCF
ncbi:MAG: hypothetical protein JF619_05095 [Massilia sp.]|nr:hypothetical protein [Massilia sp.]